LLPLPLAGELSAMAKTDQGQSELSQ
jgi:hypothetical protein